MPNLHPYLPHRVALVGIIAGGLAALVRLMDAPVNPTLACSARLGIARTATPIRVA